MEGQTAGGSRDTKNASFSFQVIDWRDKNGHLLARLIVGKDKLVFTVKCHRCKHVEEKDIQTLKI
jgi:hypothetical protein